MKERNAIRNHPALFFVMVICIFLGFFWIARSIFLSHAVVQFTKDMNTFRGILANLPTNLPREDTIGSYAFAFKDYHSHLPRSIASNANGYAFFLAILFSLFLPFQLLHEQSLKNKKIKIIKKTSAYFFILALGLAARLFFAYHFTGNYDIVSWYLNRDILEYGKNIYAITSRYNYTPIWFSIIYFLGIVSLLFPQFPFMFVIRSFLSIVDLITAWVLFKIAKRINLSPVKAVALFFLNPISIIITGYHGQFENLSVLFLLLAIYFCLRNDKKVKTFVWFFLTMGLLIKHVVINQVLGMFMNIERSWKKAIILFFLALIFFLLTFVPYWKEGAQGIVDNVFLYSGGMSASYGLISFEFAPVGTLIHKYMFILAMFLFAFFFRAKNIIRVALVNLLFFFVFTSGLSAQQMVLPIALGALIPTNAFYLYTLITSLFLFGDINELKIRLFESYNWNCVWICALVWFVVELIKSKRSSLSAVYD